MNQPQSGQDFDAIVIGAGHNGLTTAFYLAKAGLRPLVLERRDLVGGACVTEEFAPGYHASPAAHVLAMLRESIWTDMRLVERGIHVDPSGPTLTLFPDGQHLLSSDDEAETLAEISKFSPKDAKATAAFDEHLARLAKVLMPLYDQTAPDPRARSLSDLRNLARVGGRVLKSRRDIQELAFLLTTSSARYLSEWFESEHIIASHSWTALVDSFNGPSTPGTAFLLLHEHASADNSETGEARAWGFVRGGMGRVTAAMADAVREAGGVIRLDAEVQRIVTRDGRAVGVELADGETINAGRVISNADPKRTFLRMLDPDRDLPADFVRSVRAVRSSSTSMRIHLGVTELPYAKGLPGTGVQPYHTGFVDIVPFVADMDLQQAHARAGQPASPAQMEICFPTVHDPSLAPAGRHVIDIVVASQPYSGPDWDAIKEDCADRAIAQIAEYFPNLPGSIEHRQVLSPVDLERRYGMTGGHSMHAEMSPDQLLFMRPVRGFGDYRTPIDGLYLCGAGTHPGGGVTGANGKNAAHEVVRDSKRRSRRR